MRTPRRTGQSAVRAFVLLAVALASAAGQSQHPAFSVASLPLVFTPNVGQDDTNVRFSSRGFGYGIYFTRRETILAMPKGTSESAVLRMRVARANAEAIVSGIDELPGKANYLLGRDPANWHTGVSNFGKVMYKQVLPGIDLIYYGRNLRLEYDFRVAPHADPKSIEMQLDGKEWLARITPAGDLKIANAVGSVGFARPVAYQIGANGARRTVRARYALKSGGFGFDLGRYDHSRELVIDPVLVYSTYYGGQYNDSANGIAIDSQGNAYIAGSTSSSDLPTTAGSLRPNAPSGLPNNAAETGFVAKFNATGSQLIYATYLGGSSLTPNGFNHANAIAVDTNFNAYITGSTNSTDFPLRNPVQSVCGPANSINRFSCALTPVSECAIGNPGTEDAFVIKLDPTGSAPAYSTYLGGSDDDAGVAIAVNSAGEAFVVGNTLSNTSYDFCNLCPMDPPVNLGYPTTGNAYLATPVSLDQRCTSHTVANEYSVLTRLSATGGLEYSTYIGSGTASGGANSFGQAVALDAANSVYIGGGTNDPTFPVSTGAAQTTCPYCDSNVHYNGWVAKFNPAAIGAAGLIYATFLGGGAYAQVNGIAVDTQGNAYATGYTDASGGSNFPTTAGSLMPAAPAGAGKSGFVSKLNQTGAERLYSSYLGGTGDTYGSAIAVDASGAAVVTGRTESVFAFPLVDPLTFGGGSSDGCAGNCGYLVRMTPDGSADQFSTYFGWFGTAGTGVAVDGAGNAWLTGSAGSIPTTTSAYATCIDNCKPSLSTDAFVAKIGMGSACQADQSAQLAVTRGGMRYVLASQEFLQTVTIKNNTGAAIGGPINLVLVGLSSNATLANATGSTGCTSSGNPYITALASGSLAAGQSITVQLQFKDPTLGGFTYNTSVLTGAALP